MINRPISIGLAPNLEFDDVILALRVVMQPWKWRDGNALGEIRKWFASRFATPHVFTFNSGRSAEFTILQALGIGPGDEVLLQAFTCVAVPNSVLWTGAKPVYVDIDEALNIDPVDIEEKITKKTKAIIVQHTFGIPGQMDKLVTLAKKHNLFLIEDCAHSLGATYKEKEVGSFGDAAFFSFGRDKVVSSVFGGVAIVKNAAIAEKFSTSYQKLSYPPVWWICQQLLHPILFSLILPLYQSGIGKIILIIAQKLHLLSFPVYQEEKKGNKPSLFPTRLPNALGELVLHQLAKLERFNAHRQKCAAYFRKHLKNTQMVIPEVPGSIYLRFPIVNKNAEIILQEAKKQGIVLGNWYHEYIAPQGVDMKAVYFDPTTVPHAIAAAQHMVNLPTYPTLSQMQVDKVIALVNTYGNS